MTSAQRVKELLAQLSDERGLRHASGLPPDHVLNISEFPVLFSKQVVADLDIVTARAIIEYPTNPSLTLIRAFTLVLTGQYAAADAAMTAYQVLNPNDPLGRMRFALPPKGVITPADLPPVKGDPPAGPSFFIGCDKRYFQVFAAPLLRSMAHCSPGAPVHLHMMDTDPDQWRRLEPLNLTITSTSEDASAFIASHKLKPAAYYNAARMLRFVEMAGQSTDALCLMDADGLVVRDPMPLLGDAISLRMRAGRIEPVHHFSACLVTAGRDSTGYMSTVADFLRPLMDNPAWGVDQYALFAAWLRCRPTLKLYGPETAGIDGNTINGIFAFTAGAAKGRLLTDDTPFAALYRHYSVPSRPTA